MRRDWLPLLNGVRAKTAELIGATADECVIVPNTTHGINTIMQNITWQPGDRIVTCMSPSFRVEAESSFDDLRGRPADDEVLL